MKYIVLVLACAAPLAACNKGPEVRAENATGEQVAEKVAQAGGADRFVRPGMWESKVTFEEMTLPGMSAEMAAHMDKMEGRITTQRSCLTPEEAKRPKEDFFTGDNKNCRYERFNMGGGKIDAVMNCSESGAVHTMTMQGSYTPDTYNMQMAMQRAAGTAATGMAMKMRVDARRVGECTAEEAAG